jgi:hypothetical protein
MTPYLRARRRRRFRPIIVWTLAIGAVLWGAVEVGLRVADSLP